MRRQWMIALLAGGLVACGGSEPRPSAAAPDRDAGVPEIDEEAPPESHDGGVQELDDGGRGGVHGCGSCGIELIIDPSTPHRLLIEMNLDIWLRTAPAGRTLAEASLELAFPSGRAQIIDLDPGDWGPGKSIRQTIESPTLAAADWSASKALLKVTWTRDGAVEHEQYKIRRIARR